MISGTGDAASADRALPPAPSTRDLRDALNQLAAHTGTGLTEAELIDHIGLMEQLKSGLAAAQARLSVTLAAARAGCEAAAGVPADQRCRGLAAEIALARRESPVRGAQ